MSLPSMSGAWKLDMLCRYGLGDGIASGGIRPDGLGMSISTVFSDVLSVLVAVM